MTWSTKRDVIEPMAEKIGRQAETIKILEDELHWAKKFAALDGPKIIEQGQAIRSLTDRVKVLEAVRDAAAAAVRCADLCEGPHPVSQIEIVETWDRLRAALRSVEA